ncbi:uncharacterized protein LOC117297062 [Asterias rubens]|uniref:uncharacterized protein LOC117297062 n=1 Tax=Asterias rubens TaxID=7604 RepID=UPI001454F5E4|nr:uncharacterized protein LOC117297062 [Asterias rubens]
MQHHLVQLLLRLLLLFIFLPHPGQAVTTSKPKSEAFWRKFCGFFCPFQLSCDSDVYLSNQQQVDLLNSQEFLDILELFPQILIENEKLQHTTLVRLEDHQRDLILLRYKDFFHPRDTLPLARQKIVDKLAKGEQSFGGIPAAEPPPRHVHLTEGQIQKLEEETFRLEENQVKEDVAHIREGEGDVGTPDWHEAESFIRNYVNQQRIRQSEQKAKQQTFTTTGRTTENTTKRRNVISFDINHLQEQALQTNLNIDQIRQELERLGHKLDLSSYPLKDLALEETYPEPEPVEPEPRRTTELVLEEAPNAQEIISVSEHKNSGDEDDAPHTRNVNRISDKSSRKTLKPQRSESNDARTLQSYLHHHRRTQVPRSQRLTQTLSNFYDGSSLTSRSIESTEHRGSKRNSKGLRYRSAKRQLRQHRSHLLVHEPGGIAREDESSSDTNADRAVHRRVKRNSRRKRETFKMQVCPAVETWSSIVLAETINGTLVQLAQFPEVNQGQWFLQEKCLYESSPIIKGVTCEIRERYVDAIVIPVVDPTQPIQAAKIKVECCMSMFNVELNVNVEPEEELSTTPSL